MRFKKLVLGFGLGSLLLIGGNMAPRQALALSVRLPLPPPSPCTEILACTATNSNSFAVAEVDDGCNLGLAVGDDCSADVTKALTSSHSCFVVNGPSAIGGDITYSIFCGN
jgi:hypothetical protein